MQKIVFIFCLVLNLLMSTSWAATGQAGRVNTSIIEKTLADEGFLNWSVDTTNQQIIVGYENRIFRFERHAVDKILQIIKPYWSSPYDQLILVSKYRGLPLSQTSFNKEITFFDSELTDSLSNIQFNPEDLGSKGDLVNESGRSRRSAQYRLLLEIEPRLKFNFGADPDPFLHQISVATSIRAFLWKGASCYAELIIPVDNELDIPEESMVRPGLITFNQIMVLPQRRFIDFTAGYFTNYRYGAVIKLHQFLFRDRLRLSAKLGYTGYAAYPARLAEDRLQAIWEWAIPTYTDYSIALEYRWSQWNLLTKIEYGRYLFFREGAKVAFLRQFGDFDMGFFALQSQRGNNYGFNLSIPFWPKQYQKPGLFQARLATHFNYTYFATQNYLADYEVGDELIRIMRKVHPDFLGQAIKRPKQ